MNGQSLEQPAASPGFVNEAQDYFEPHYGPEAAEVTAAGIQQVLANLAEVDEVEQQWAGPESTGRTGTG